MAICSLILLVYVTFSLAHLRDAKEGIIWPSHYYLKAEKINIKASLVEPMELWSSTEYNRSRIDYYGGSVKNYYYWESKNDSAFIVKVFPESTEDFKNKIICGATRKNAKLHDLLPNVHHFKYVEEKQHEGRLVRVWEHNHLVLKYLWYKKTLYTYQSADGVDVPVQYVMKSYYNEKGALFGHTIMNYFGYSSIVNKNDLDAQESCPDSYLLGDDFHRDVEYLHPSMDTNVDLAFHSYVKHHNKNYLNKSEHEMRKSIFQQNWEMITNHNRQNRSYNLELNHFADFTSDEVTSSTGLLPVRGTAATHAFPHTDEEVKALADELPQNYDMRLEGVISPVKNQACCGSCWAFSSAAALEGALARSNGGRIMDLSEQSLVDCAWGFGNRGCNGGDMTAAMRYILAHGIPLEEQYGSYLEQDGFCHADNMSSTYTIKGFSAVTKRSPEALKVALYKYGPVAVGITFNNKMRFYSKGIFYDPECNTERINHGVVVVGFGVQDGAEYWIIKNSHGADWGEEGYILISAADNNCFVLEDAVYPIV